MQTEVLSDAQPFDSSTQELDLLGEWAVAPVCALNSNLHVVAVSRWFAARFARPVSSFAGTSMAELMGARNVDVLRPYFERVLQGERIAVQMHYTILTPKDAAAAPQGTLEATLEMCPADERNGVWGGFLVMIRDQGSRKAVGVAPAPEVMPTVETQDALVSIPMAACVVNRGGTIGSISSLLAKWYGSSTEALVETQFSSLIAKTDFDALLPAIDQVLGGETVQLEQEMRFYDGISRWLRIQLSPIKSAQARIEAFLFSALDISPQKRMEAALQQANWLLTLQFENSPMAAFALNSDLILTRWTSKAASLLGWHQDEVIEKSIREMSLTDDDTFGLLFAKPGRRDQRLESQTVFANALRRDGTSFPAEWRTAVLRDHTGAITAIHCLVSNTSQIESTPERAPGEAHRDVLTGLLNRSMVESSFRQKIDHARAKLAGVAALFVDLDNFKTTNDTLGHRIGDAVLVEVALRLRNCVLATDPVIRLGGDEFMILLGRANPKAASHEVAARILSAIRAPIVVESHRITIGASIGISVYPDHGLSAESLLRHADLAMYRAKEGGKNSIAFFSPSLAQKSERRHSVRNALERAIRDDELKVYFQPRVRISDNVLVGAEALLRWNDTRLGAVAPSEFVRIAEDTGLIQELGIQMFRKAALQAVDWASRGIPAGILAVNFSAKQLVSDRFIDELDRVMRDTGCDPSHFEAEITETSILQEIGTVQDVVRKLKSRGMRIAIDDFGTGFSSLSHLQQLSVDTLKIDKSFVNGIPGNAEDMAITNSVINLARGLGMSVTAEGVENERQLRCLRDAGCNSYQGFLYSPAVVPADFEMLAMESHSAAQR